MKEKKIKKEILIAFRVPKELFDIIQKHAEKEENTVSGIIRKAIKEYLRKRNEDGRL